jgi:hypothetical protein
VACGGKAKPGQDGYCHLTRTTEYCTGLVAWQHTN